MRYRRGSRHFNEPASSERSPSPRRTAIVCRGVRKVSIDRTPGGCGVVALNGCTSTPRTGCAYTRFLRFDSVWGRLIAVDLDNPDWACPRPAKEIIETRSDRTGVRALPARRGSISV